MVLELYLVSKRGESATFEFERNGYKLAVRFLYQELKRNRLPNTRTT